MVTGTKRGGFVAPEFIFVSRGFKEHSGVFNTSLVAEGLGARGPRSGLAFLWGRPPDGSGDAKVAEVPRTHHPDAPGWLHHGQQGLLPELRRVQDLTGFVINASQLRIPAPFAWGFRFPGTITRASKANGRRSPALLSFVRFTERSSLQAFLASRSLTYDLRLPPPGRWCANPFCLLLLVASRMRAGTNASSTAVFCILDGLCLRSSSCRSSSRGSHGRGVGAAAVP